MATLDEIREKLQNIENKKKAVNFNSDSALYLHWKMPDDASCTVRFLPDGDENNTFFWQEKQVIRLEFPGIKGGDESKRITVQVPCIEMWGETCPVHAEIRPWFKDSNLEDLARKYWKKRSYIFQGLVQSDGIPEQDPPENPIRRFIFGNQIFTIIKQALLDPEMEYTPTDYINGRNFVINKDKKGRWSNYTTSKWSMNSSSLTEEQLEAIDKYGLTNLSTFLPKKPSQEEVDVIFEMFEASVAGDLYDPEKWANYYKPFGVDLPNTSTSSNTSPQQSSSTTDEDKTEETQETSKAVDEDKTEEKPSGNQSAKEILEMLQNRREK